MKYLILFISFFILYGCEDLHFTDEDIHTEAPKSKVTKEEIKEEVDSFDTEIETLSPNNQKEISITIEERESVPDTREIENLKNPIAEEITESFGGEVKVSITDTSLEDTEEDSDSDLTETKEKVTEWKISRRETEKTNP